MASSRGVAPLAVGLAILTALLAVARADERLLVTGDPTWSMDRLVVDEGSTRAQEASAVANYMKIGSYDYHPSWSTAGPLGWGGPQVSAQAPHKLGFAQKHPNLVLAMQLGLAVKALEKLSDSPLVDAVLGRAEDKASALETYLPPRSEHMVTISGGNFVAGRADGECSTLYLSGTNKYELVEAGAGAPYLYDGKLEEGVTGPEVVRRVMRQAREQGLTFIRFNAFAVDPDFSVLSAAGSPPAVSTNEAILRGLDYVVDEARKEGLRVLLVLTDYFRDGAGGPLQYMRLCGTDLTGLTDLQIKARFYTDAPAQGIFRGYVSAIITRVNTINGRTYSADPTILGWDIMNEPRCEDDVFCTLSSVPTFVQAIYSFIKTNGNSQQPVTVGTEGFYDVGPNSAQYPVGLNPLPSGGVRADFATLCALVDFCEFNTYPDQWGQQTEGFVDSWVAGHSASGVNLGKPVIVKEQGMQPTSNRTYFYSIMYTSNFEQIVRDRRNAGGLRGAAYFEAWVPGTKAVAYTLAVGGRYGILPDDPAARFVRLYSDEVEALSRPATGCTAPPAVILPLPKCKPGFEGPQCEDINECVRGTDSCSKHAACVNTPGYYTCKCHLGYLGDGRVCAPEPVHLGVIHAAFYTNDTINCASSSTPVVYPEYAPGWVYDPTGSSDAADGNRVPVSLQGCKTACLLADDCTSFFFDEGQRKCLLRKHECPYIGGNVPGCSSPGSGVPQPTICTGGLQYTPNSAAPPTPVPTYECGRAITYFLRKHTELPAGCTPTAPV